MGYGYSNGYGYGSGFAYSYGYSSPPPPALSPPVSPPPCPSLSKPSFSPPPVPDSAAPPPVPDYAPPSVPVPSNPPPVPVPSNPPPVPVPSNPPPVPVPSNPPPSVPPPYSPLPVPSIPPPSEPSLPPPVPVSEPPLASPPQVPASSPPQVPVSSPPFKTVKPHAELYYSPPPPVQLTTPPPALPPVSTEPYMSPPPPPLEPASQPPLVPASPPPIPNSPPPVPKSPLAPKSSPPESALPPLSPPVSAPVPTPSTNPYTPPAPVATYNPPPPKRLAYSPPQHPKAPTRPFSVNPNANNTSQNIVISREAAAAIVVVAGLVTLSFVGAAFWFVKQRRRPETEEPIRHMRNFMPSPTVGSQFSEPPASAGGPSGSRSQFPFRPGSQFSAYSPSSSTHNLPPSKQYFTYSDLLIFTSNFSSSHLLGSGGFGQVYKGVLPDGRQVAVKKLKESGGQGDREFKTEVDIISRVHHRHLVSLVGCCVDEGERVLVYDYVENGTLYYHLHRDEGPVLSWSLRVKIAAGAARGIAYLHEDCHPRIIHRDIKSSNILIDNNFEAQVSDFGLARLAMDANSQVTTRVMGTFGYLAPEYALSGKLTAKSDVYSFGVVLLELITGRKPVDSSQPLGDESLVEWAKPYLVRALENRDFGELPDPKLENKFDEVEMHRMIEAAAACVRHSSSMRPRMAQVVRALDSLVSDTNLTNGIPPGHSEIFEPQTEEIRMFQMREFGDCSSELSQASSRRQRNL